jgi:hypothetical protein
MSESLNGKVLSSAGRGLGKRRRIQFKANQSQERGLIENLPVLKYSSRMEDQMPLKFIFWKEKLFEYIQNDGNYSPIVAAVIKDDDPDDEADPDPPLGLNPAWNERDLWKDEMKRVRDCNDKLAIDKMKVYALIIGQCGETVKQKLSAQAGWNDVEAAQSPSDLNTTRIIFLEHAVRLI